MEHNGGERTCIVAWCDFDNDGRLDILLSGYSHTAGHAITQIWRNTGGGFTNIQANLPGLMSGDASCGDFDNDGWMDLMLAGQTNYYAASCDIWRNIGGGFSNLNAGLTPILRHCAAKEPPKNNLNNFCYVTS